MMNYLKKDKKLAHEMLSELSPGNKQRMNTMKHELKVKLKLIENQRKRSLEIINNETKLISIELAQIKPKSMRLSEKTLHQSTAPRLSSAQQTLPNKFLQSRTHVPRSSDELPYGRSCSDLVSSNNVLNTENTLNYSRCVAASPDNRTVNTFYPKGVNQYTSEFRKKFSELNTSRLHNDTGMQGKMNLQTPGLNHYLRAHSGGVNNGVLSDTVCNRNARRNSDSSLQIPNIVLSEDRVSLNTDEQGTYWVQADNLLTIRAHTASGVTGRKSSTLLLPSLDAPSRNFQTRDNRAPKSLCIGRQRSFQDQGQFVPRQPSCRGYNIKSLASLHQVMQRSSVFKTEDLEKTEYTSQA